MGRCYRVPAVFVEAYWAVVVVLLSRGCLSRWLYESLKGLQSLAEFLRDLTPPRSRMPSSALQIAISGISDSPDYHPPQGWTMTLKCVWSGIWEVWEELQAEAGSVRVF